MSIFLSVWDSDGNIIEEVDQDSFSIIEDNQALFANSLETVKGDANNIILVLDTSASMYKDNRMEAAKTASQALISSLESNDQVAVFTFDSEVNRIAEFSTDLSDVSDQVKKINYNPGGGTCLYDGLYDAVQLAKTAPAGKRAILLLTDGYDQMTQGNRCSIHTLDDVLEIASKGSSRVPVFTIGLGQKEEVDTQSLRSIAELTGGWYALSPDSYHLEDNFLKLGRQLESSYVLKYTSNAASAGEHTVVVKASYLGSPDEDSFTFKLPPLPPQVIIAYPPNEGEIVSPVKIIAEVVERGEGIGNVVFEIDGAKVWVDEKPPYELDWDFGENYGAKEISVFVMGADGNVASEDKVTVEVVTLEEYYGTIPQLDEPLAPSSNDDESTVSVESTPNPDVKPKSNTGLIIAIVVGVIVIAAVTIYFVMRNKKKPAPIPDPFVLNTSDKSSILARITVENSDDSDMIGQVWDIVKDLTTFGRNPTNDIAFPEDNPVSRKHAELVHEEDHFVLRNIVSIGKDGETKFPTYGTFINNEELFGDATRVLESGDLIQLGRRVKLYFELVLPEPVKEQEIALGDTLDGIDITGITGISDLGDDTMESL